MKRFQDRVAIVTGAGCVGPGWGNGRATAVRFAEEGAQVFAVDRSADALKETLGHSSAIRSHICDVTRARDVEAMARACVDAFGRIDVLVNNVGGRRPAGRSR